MLESFHEYKLKSVCITECWGVPSYFYRRDPDPFLGGVQLPFSSFNDQEMIDEEDISNDDNEGLDDCNQELKVSDCDQDVDEDIVLKTRQRKSHGKRGKNKLLFTRMGRGGNNKLLFTRMGRASNRNET